MFKFYFRFVFLSIAFALQRLSSSTTPIMIRKPAVRPQMTYKKEIALLRRIKPHRNIVLFMGACWEPLTQLMHLFELCANGNLRDFIRKVHMIVVRKLLSRLRHHFLS